MSPSDRSPLSVRDLRKRYGAVTAVDGVSFEVTRGECLGLLGPNGAGKTTTLSIACSLVRADSGSVSVNGIDVAADPEGVRRSIGLVPQEVSLYDDLTAEENLLFFGSLYGLRGEAARERTREALAQARLEDRAKDRVATFSGGMKRRLNFAVGTLHAPPLLLLDEPTVGVDPQSRNHLFEMVAALKQEGITIVYTTHYMEEAERLCDRVAIIDHGRLVALGTRDELVMRIGARDQVELAFPAGASPSQEALDRVLDGIEWTAQPDGVLLSLGRELPLEEVRRRLERSGIALRSLTVRSPDLEAVFLALTGRALRD
jgi:ABC-2 type transport system ATP-binding protein